MTAPAGCPLVHPPAFAHSPAFAQLQASAHSLAPVQSRHRGSVLIVVLGVFTLLAVLAISALRTTQIDLRLAASHRDKVQARYLALAGIEHAKAWIHADEAERQRLGTAFTTRLFDDASLFAETELGRGTFQVTRTATADEGGGTLPGILDEERRLDVNHASVAELTRLPGLSEDVAAAIVDWRDADDTPQPGGAEADHYLGLHPPLRIANAPFLSVAELQHVRGVLTTSLLGEDVNANGWLDPDEDDGDTRWPPDDANGRLDAGWSEHLTVGTAVPDTDASGRARIDVTRADLSELQEVSGISEELARGIIAFRERAALRTLADLLQVTRVEEGEAGAAVSAGAEGSPAGNTPPPSDPPPSDPPAMEGNEGAGGATPSTPSSLRDTGEQIFSQSLLIEVADRLTTRQDGALRGVVNLNTAAATVLECLGLEPEQAQAVVDHRSSGPYTSSAQLLEVPGLGVEEFRRLAPRVTVRSGTFRIGAEGRVAASGARLRITVVVRAGTDGFWTLSYREDD